MRIATVVFAGALGAVRLFCSTERLFSLLYRRVQSDLPSRVVVRRVCRTQIDHADPGLSQPSIPPMRMAGRMEPTSRFMRRDQAPWPCCSTASRACGRPRPQCFRGRDVLRSQAGNLCGSFEKWGSAPGINRYRNIQEAFSNIVRAADPTCSPTALTGLVWSGNTLCAKTGPGTLVL